MINKLTLNADTKPWELTKDQALLAAKGAAAFAKVEAEALSRT